MSNTEYMDVSPSQVSGQSGNHLSLKQTTSEEACEFGAECIHSEPLESKHLLGSEAAPNEPQEISSAVTRSPDDEKLPAFCGDVLDKSFTEHLVLPPEDVSKSSQTKNILCSQENTLEQKHEICSECVHSEKSERKHQLEFHIVCNEPREISLVMCSSGDNDKLRPVFQDASKCSQINSKNTLEFRSVNGCVELDTGCLCSKTSEQNYQLGSEIMHKEPANTDAVVPSGVVHENLQTTSEDMTKIIPTEPLQSPLRDVNNRFQTGEKSCPQQSTSEWTPEVTAGIASHEPLEVNDKHDFLLVQNRPTEISTATSCYISTEKLGSPSEFVIKSSPIEHLKQPEVPITTPISEHLGPYSDDMTKNSSLEQSETPSKRAVNNSRSLGRKGKKASKALKKKYMLRSLRGNDRVLRSTSGRKSKALESSNHLADVSSIRGRKRQKQKNRRGKIAADEYSRIRTHLRYLVNRINYEQSLIAAYSSEGWKGLSIEKLKPEKELQRATSEILRRKLKIRDLFQRLDSLCSEGSFPKSLFDSEGQIDSEDIFCAKCGSKELLADNDIILCDGACDRGFHQYCLEPPLLKEDIPPDDEGWLCPGCDCKVDCIDLVNELHGTNLFITDKWEKVFPEAAAAAGHNQDPNFGLLSDDSDDDDYDPDGPAIVKKDQGDESSSDESDFSSTSDDLEASANGQEYLGLPSDDSEDDEYNPDAPELNDKVMQESSSSDFTSDSEDLAAVVEDSGSSGNEEGAISVSPLRDSNGKRSKLGGNEESLNNELLSILESGKDGAAPVYGKRSIERLDYKKLYDETYARVPSDSSDDEDWSENDGPMKRTKSTREGFSVSPNGTAPGTRSGKNTKDTKKNINEVEHIPKRRGCRKLNSEDTNISHEGSSIPGSTKRERSSYKRLGEDVTQKLYKSFKENRYPDRSKKETLAKELGITFSQVSKWFENTRWSFNHSSSMDARMGTIALEKTSCTPQPNNRSVRRVSTCSVSENVESPKTAVDDTRYSSGDVKDSELVTEESGRRKPTTRLSRKRKQKDKLEHQASCTDSKIEVIHALAADSPKVQETQTNGRTRRRRNSAA